MAWNGEKHSKAEKFRIPKTSSRAPPCMPRERGSLNVSQISVSKSKEVEVVMSFEY
jgi:hypothetical protein